MPHVVETGAGLSNANAYLSDVDADAYFADHGDPVAWTGASVATKQLAIRQATQYLDAVYGDRWRGCRVKREQALDWPRVGVSDRDGFTIDSDKLPQALKDATAEAALRSITETNGLIPDIAKPGAIKLERSKVGPLEKETEYAGGRSQIKRFRLVEQLLADLVEDLSMAGRA